jgi:chromosome partitioning protein
MPRTIAFVNHKGGVGKTTLTLFSARILAQSKRVLAVDFDPQANLTQSFDINPDSLNETVLECLVKKKPLVEAVLRPLPSLPNLHLLPATLDLEELEVRFLSVPGRDVKLAHLLNQARDNYDFILIDSAPRGGLFMVAPMLAASDIVIPVDASEYSLRGLVRTSEAIEGVKEVIEGELRTFVLFNQMDRTIAHRDQRGILESHFPNSILGASIRKTVTATKITNSADPTNLTETMGLWEDVAAFLTEIEALP